MTLPGPPDWSGAVSALQQSDSIVLIAHVTPDADALGSALALGVALRTMGKRVQVSVGEPGFHLPASLSFLPGADLIVEPGAVVMADAVVACDTASVERLGVLADVVRAAEVCIAIDHHPTFDGFGTIHVVDPHAPATAALALRLIDLLDVPLDRDIATAVYAGLATDTGSFRYESADADTLRTAARLYETGFDHSGIARLLFDDEPFQALRVLGIALGNAVLLPDAVGGLGLVYTWIAAADRPGLSELAMERVIDTVRRTSEAEVAAVFKQADDGTWKGSLRSKTLVNVGDVARGLGGGGHTRAAGYTSALDRDGTIATLIAALDQ